MCKRQNVTAVARRLLVAAVASVLIAALACGGSDSEPTPTGTNGNGGGGPANALLIIGSPSEVNGLLADAVSLDKVDTYLLTSLSQDPASFQGVTFGGTDTVWGVQLLGPQEAAAADFNAAYLERYGEPPSSTAWHAYDAVYTIALAAVTANAGDGAAIKDNLTYVANSPGYIAGYGSDGFAEAVEALAPEGGDVNYTGASGQVDVDISGDMSKATVQTWKVLNGQITPIETRDVDLAAEAGDEVPVGGRKRAPEAPVGALVIGMVVTNDLVGTVSGNGAQLALEEINAAGGVFDQDVVLQSETIADAGAAGTAVDSLVQAGANAIIGPAASDAVSSALDRAKAASVPLLALSDAPELSLLETGGFLTRLVPSLELQMPVLANLALESEAGTFCVVYAQGPAGEALAAAFKRAVEYKEATIRSSQSYDPASGDYTSLLQSCLG